MIGYILIGIGAWLVYDDHKIAKAKKSKEGGSNGIHENGNDRRGGDSAGKSGELHQKPDRNGRVTAPPDSMSIRAGIGIPVTKTKGGKNDVSKKSVHKVELDENRDSVGDNSHGKPDTTAIGNKGKSLTKKSKEGGRDAEYKINNENDAGDNGNDVGAESSSRNESDSTEINQGDGSSTSD